MSRPDRERPTGRLRSWRRYLVAFALALVVILGRVALDPVWGRQNNRHLVLLPTVMVAAWIGGMGPALVVTILCTTALATFWDNSSEFLHGASGPLLFFFISVAVAKVIDSLKVARAEAEASKAAQKQVLAVVAHDLRNPLSAVKMTAVALVETSTDDAMLMRRLRSIERAVHRMETLIRDLVDTARIERGEFSLTTRDERVDSLVQDAVEALAPLASEKNISLETKVEPGEAIVGCDRDRLLQALGNLLGNAIKFTPLGGTVALQADRRADSVRFEVADTGPGIPPDQLTHIFDPYWKTDPRGTGLGLFIAQNIVRAHGAALEVTSEPGHGAMFSFSLPLRAAP